MQPTSATGNNLFNRPCHSAAAHGVGRCDTFHLWNACRHAGCTEELVLPWAADESVVQDCAIAAPAHSYRADS